MIKVKALVLIVLMCLTNILYASSSQKRLHNESFKQALHRILKSNRKNPGFLLDNGSVLSNRVPVESINYSSVSEVSSEADLMSLFTLIRDTRRLVTDSRPEFLRRISWLYPDDGCFSRAGYAEVVLENSKLERLSKVFAFGNLTVNTPYSPDGYVYWWYHVAIIVQFNGNHYVFDPAINPQKPMLVDEWYNTMGAISDLEGAVCSSNTYDPFDDCSQTMHTADTRSAEDQINYLEKEWNRMYDLGIDPEVVLGTNPPWFDDILQNIK